VRHVQRAGLLRRRGPEQVRRQPAGRRHVQSEDVRGPSRPLRSAGRRLRRRDGVLPSVHVPADLWRRRDVERVRERGRRRRRRAMHPRHLPGSKLRQDRRRVRGDRRLREHVSWRPGMRRRRHPERVRGTTVHSDHQLPCGHELRVHRRWLRRHRLVRRRVHRSRDLRRWQSAERVRRRNDRRPRRRHLHAQEMRGAGQELRPGGRRLRWPHRELAPAPPPKRAAAVAFPTCAAAACSASRPPPHARASRAASCRMGAAV
jgi:hypothetical protein